jgi:hypothetical protein
LKKRTKKLLLLWGMGAMTPTPQAQSQKVFLLLFLQKKKRLPYFNRSIFAPQAASFSSTDS